MVFNNKSFHFPVFKARKDGCQEWNQSYRHVFTFDGALSAKKLVPRRSLAAQNKYEDNSVTENISIPQKAYKPKLALACVKWVLGIYGYIYAFASVPTGGVLLHTRTDRRREKNDCIET